MVQFLVIIFALFCVEKANPLRAAILLCYC